MSPSRLHPASNRSRPAAVPWWASLLLVAALLAGISSCADRPSPAKGSGPSSTTAEAVAPHELVVQPVAWPPGSSVDQAVRATLPPAARAAVERATVPVLVVNRPEALQHITIIAKPLWVASSTGLDGVSISLSATRAAHRYRHIPPAQGRASVRGQPAFVTQNTRIWSAAWLENGAAYCLDVECASHLDPRCDDDQFLLELGAQLSYVGGAGQGGSQ
jgi:hypothetical protein